MALLEENLDEIWNDYDAEKASEISRAASRNLIKNKIEHAKSLIISAILEGNYRCMIQFESLYEEMPKDGGDYAEFKETILKFTEELKDKGYKTNLEDYGVYPTDGAMFTLEVIWRVP